MNLIEVPDAAELGRRAAAEVIALLRRKPDALITLPTGNTPLPMFRELAAASRTDPRLFTRMRFVTLDEYAGIPHDDRRRLSLWLRRELFGPAGLSNERIIALDPMAEADAECARVERRIEELGGLDLAVLGLGPNGHLGFNEPGSSFASRTRHVVLTPESLRSNAAYWGGEGHVPRHGLTLGLATILDAKAIVLIVSGASKAEVLRETMQGPIAEALPATCLRRHRNATVIADRAALAS